MASIPTVSLRSNPLFQGSDDETLGDPHPNRLKDAFARAKLISAAYNITSQDALRCTEKFWNMHLDPICLRDLTAWVFMTIQTDLVAPTVGYYASQSNSRDLEDLAESMIRCDVSAWFMMNEVGHGIDALNLETTATLLKDGTYDLHTPRLEAEK
ncbi:hypothetical protein V5O48_007498 [Marasmius crinis-equi]|uniref:Uncharacterized protein n=1 Tax=Marasmius crinis-equi TaxID=585013 RepID=A0ABR3FH44_9AGAR